MAGLEQERDDGADDENRLEAFAQDDEERLPERFPAAARRARELDDLAACSPRSRRARARRRGRRSPRTAPLKSANMRSIDATSPGFCARAPASRSARTRCRRRTPCRARRRCRPLRAAVSDCSSSDDDRPRQRRARRQLSADARPRSRSFIGSVRRYATTLCTCAGVSSADGGIAVAGMPSRTTAASCVVAALRLPRDVADLGRQSRQRPRERAVAGAGHAVAGRAALRVQPFPFQHCACVARSELTYATTFQRCSGVSVRA